MEEIEKVSFIETLNTATDRIYLIQGKEGKDNKNNIDHFYEQNEV